MLKLVMTIISMVTIINAQNYYNESCDSINVVEKVKFYSDEDGNFHETAIVKSILKMTNYSFVCTSSGDNYTEVVDNYFADVTCFDCKPMGSRICSGDQEYCTSVGKCNVSSCRCTSKLGVSQDVIYDGHYWVPVNVVNRTLCYKPIEFKFDNRPIRFGFTLDRSLTKKRQNIIFDWKQPVLEIKEVPSLVAIVFNKGPLTMSISTNTSYFLTFPSYWYEDDNPIYVRVYSGPVIVESWTLNVKTETLCPLPDCVFCSELTSSFSCFPNSFKIAVGFFFFFFAMFILILFYLMIQGIKNCMCGVVAMPINVSMDSNNMKTIAILLLFLPLCMGCDRTVLISSQQMICLTSLGVEECRIEGDSLLLLNYPGEVVCLQVSSTGTGISHGRIEIKWISMEMIFLSNTLYFTGSYIPSAISESHCPGTSQCSTNNCLNNNYYIRAMNNAGERGCVPTCGCAGCGCVICSDSCTYWQYELLTNFDNTAKVNRLDGSIMQPYVQVTVISDDFLRNQTMSIDNNWQEVIPGVKIHVEGSLQGPDLSLPNSVVSSIIHDNIRGYYSFSGDSYLVDSSDRNSPIKGTIGEIQSGDIYSFNRNPSPNFRVPIFDEDIGRFEYPNFIISNSAFDRLTRNNPNAVLPTVRSGVSLFSRGEGSLLGLVSNPGALVVSLRLTNLTSRQIVNRVCPVGDFINITGYYSYIYPATMFFELKSICDSGECLITSSSDNFVIFDPSISLTSEYEVYKVRFSSNVEEVSFNVRIVCSGGELNYTIMGKLDRAEIILDDNRTIVFNNDSTKSGSFYVSWSSAKQGGFIAGMSTITMLIALFVFSFICCLPELMMCLRSPSYTKIKNVIEAPVNKMSKKKKNDDTNSLAMNDENENDIELSEGSSSFL